MNLDPQASAVLGEIEAASARLPKPRDAAEKLAQARAGTNALARFSGPMPEIALETLSAGGRHGPIPVELCRPTQGELGLLVWFHGGGAIAGSIETHRAPLASIALRSGFAVASVGYRLAPEHPFPVPQEDCIDAAFGLAERAGDFGLDPSRVVVGGDSIGGLFATNVARLWQGQPLAGQILLYPNTDMRPNRAHPSLVENDGKLMSRASLAYEADCHIPDPIDRQTPLASPLLADDLAGLPPALFVTCGADPLRDEGEAYGDRLAAAGVKLTRRPFPGMIHAFLQMGARIDAADALVDDVADFLRGLR